MLSSEFIESVLQGKSSRNERLRYKNGDGREIFTIDISEGLEAQSEDLEALLQNTEDNVLQDYILVLKSKHNNWIKIAEEQFLEKVFLNGALCKFIKGTKVHTLKVDSWLFGEDNFERVMNFDVIEFKFTRETKTQQQLVMNLLSEFKRLEKLTLGELVLNRGVADPRPQTEGDRKINLFKWFGYKIKSIPESLKLIKFEQLIQSSKEEEEQFVQGIDMLSFHKDYSPERIDLAVYLK